jgi:hypothetical protein
MLNEKEKLQKRLVKKAEKNNVPYYHELSKFKKKIDLDYEKLKLKHTKLQQDFKIYEELLEEYRRRNNSQNLE